MYLGSDEVMKCFWASTINGSGNSFIDYQINNFFINDSPISFLLSRNVNVVNEEYDSFHLGLYLFCKDF